MSKSQIQLNLLTVLWQNYKNTEENFYHTLKQNKKNSSLLSLYNKVMKENENLEGLFGDIKYILLNNEQDFQEINEILRRLGSPKTVEESNCIREKTEWILGHFQAENGRLRSINNDLEDKLTEVKHENFRIHEEFKDFMSRTNREEEKESIEEYKSQIKLLQEKYSRMEDEFVFTKSLLDTKEAELVYLSEELDSYHKFNDTKSEDSQDASSNQLNQTHKTVRFDTNNQSSTQLNQTDNKLGQCVNCNKHDDYIDKLLSKIDTIQTRYSRKRETHRLQLMEARTRYQVKYKELEVQVENWQRQCEDLRDKLRLSQLKLSQTVLEKSQYSARILPLEDDVKNLKFITESQREKIDFLENHIKILQNDLSGTPDVVPK